MSHPGLKHFCNDPKRLVTASLRSLTILNPSLCLDTENNVVFLPPPQTNGRTPGQVAIISGGGSGHEPSFGAFVGTGLLTASVSGSIFASPNSKQILSAIHRVADSSSGILVTVMNYTGDVLNFGVAVESFKAQRPDMPIRTLTVGDDVGVPRSKFGKVGRRGMAGTVLVHKATGALANLGYGLDTVAEVGQTIANNLVTIGIALDRVHVPGSSEQESIQNGLKHDELELGMGIHNEAGCARIRLSEVEFPDLVKIALQQLLDNQGKERAFVTQWAGPVILMVNNLGGLSVLELGMAVAELVDQLTPYGLVPERVYCGTFMTSLDCPGLSITLLNVVPLGIPHDILSLLDHPSQATGWKPAIPNKKKDKRGANPSESAPKLSNLSGTMQARRSNLVCNIDLAKSSLRAGLEAVIRAEPEITKYDSIVGDGDCGTTLKRGAEDILDGLSNNNQTDLTSLLSSISASVGDSMDGTSGAIYSIFLNALQQRVQKVAEESVTADVEFWSRVLSDALKVLESYTPARPGDRTLMDALIPFIHTFNATLDVGAAAKAALQGAESTRSMTARLGRTVYVGNESDWVGVIPDPGAWGLCKLFEGIAVYLQGTS